MPDIDEAKVAPSTHVGMLLHCFLCHGRLPEPARSYEHSSSDGWPFEARLVSVFPYTAEDGSVREQLRSIHTQQLKALQKSTGTAYNTPFMTQNPFVTESLVGECGNATLCGDYCRDCTPDRMVYLAHRDCWKVAFSSHHWSPFDWSRLAVQTRAFDIRNWSMKHQPTICHEELFMPTLSSVPPIQGEVWTELGKLLARIRDLPAELQLQTMSYLKGTMFGSLLRTRRFVLEVMPLLRPVPTWTFQPRTKSLRTAPGGEESCDSLSCRFNTIMDRPYLIGLTLGQPTGSKSHIPIIRKAVRGVQFALGRLGLRGIRIWYEDTSFSPWLGEANFCWIGTIRCFDLSNLRVISDELRVIKIESSQSIQSQPETSVMWWDNSPPVRSHILVQGVPDRQLHHYWGWKQFQYLPLEFEGHYASGLTVYLGTNFSDVLGIVSHGPSDFMSREAEFPKGAPARGTPFHIAFSPGEYLSSAWLHLAPRSSKKDCGMIVLATNLGRVHFLGSYPFSRQARLFGTAWVRLSACKSAKIHGLVLNVPELIAGTCDVPVLGVSQPDALPPQVGEDEIQPPELPVIIAGPTLPSPFFTYYLRKRELRFGFTRASLNNISTIHVRKKYIRTRSSWISRCVGLRIVHDDSSIEILGRWDPRDKRSISKLYDTSEGYLISLSFHMADYWKAIIVNQITVAVTDAPWGCQSLEVLSVESTNPPSHIWSCESTGDPPCNQGTRTFDCTQTSQRVAWWFTNAYDDISRDHGILEIQAQGDYSDSSFGDPLKAIQVDCDGMST